MIYAVDFDGTLCRGMYPKIGEPITKMIEWCKQHKESGDKLILWTCRNGELLEEAIEWCKNQGIEFDAINENLSERIEEYGSDTRKVSADFYIDDKNLMVDELEKRGEIVPLKPKDREYRNLIQLNLSQEPNKRIDSDHYVDGYATTWDAYLLGEKDGVQYFERVDRNAFDGADMSDIIMQLNHEGRVFARNSNSTLIAEPNDHGFFIAADLSRSAAARELHNEIQEGLITKMSWAFTVADEEYDKENRTRIIKRVKKVYDVSAVSIPANDGTEISARSYLDGVIEVEKQELQELEKQILIHKLRRFRK